MSTKTASVKVAHNPTKGAFTIRMPPGYAKAPFKGATWFPVNYDETVSDAVERILQLNGIAESVESASFTTNHENYVLYEIDYVVAQAAGGATAKEVGKARDELLRMHGKYNVLFERMDRIEEELKKMRSYETQTRTMQADNTRKLRRIQETVKSW